MKKFLAAPAVMAASLLALSACAEPPGSEPASSGAPSTSASAGAGDAAFKACMVSDSGGFDDKSFNQTSYKGLTDAAEQLGVETGEVQSSTAADFDKNVQAMVDADCNIIVTVGFLLNDATAAAAEANEDIDFAIVDSNPEGSADLDNLKPLLFNTAESSFLAGYLAAGMSETGTVGTFGGVQIPTVTIFMDGFAQGVAHHNETKGTDVKVIGWNSESQDGQFVPGDDPFQNIAGGKQTAETLVSQGADILFPVAGPAGEGALQVAQSSGGDVNAIWVDTDGCVSAEQYCENIVSSVYKGMDVAVFDAIEASMNDEFDNTPFVGTLENEGTGLSPFNQFEDKVPAELKTELDQLRSDIESGTIEIESAAQPK
ncbi:BMP family lipoprotein [Auraticoccus monumenti]|uniref:Nucleoside-binding protein n=1 Tax=Auraticoccus monumenti TaxID=675864 RepID=A0A1G6XRR4_9ACTN|nr:BMP family ABC transporter substrate-binding protein [Auraticoccus monumenti]SDD80423.1 nucleoside-binding protein [Auraticoccus monumenti]